MKEIKGKTLKEFMKKNSKTAEIYYLNKMPIDKSKATQMMSLSGEIAKLDRLERLHMGLSSPATPQPATKDSKLEDFHTGRNNF